MAESQYLSIAASKSGDALKAVPKLSQNFVAYIQGLVALSPYQNGPFDSRAKGVAEHASAEALSRRAEDPEQAQERALHELSQ